MQIKMGFYLAIRMPVRAWAAALICLIERQVSFSAGVSSPRLKFI